MVTRTDVQAIGSGDSRLPVDPVGLAIGFTIANRATDAGAVAYGDGQAGVVLTTAGLAGIGQRRHGKT